MGNKMSIKNETDDYYSYCFRYHPEWEGIVHYDVLPPNAEHVVDQRPILTTLYIKYGKETDITCRYSPMLQRYYNGIQNPCFYIRRVGVNVQLCCSLGGEQPWCIDLGERERQLQREELERRKREEEKKRGEEKELVDD